MLAKEVLYLNSARAENQDIEKKQLLDNERTSVSINNKKEIVKCSYRSSKKCQKSNQLEKTNRALVLREVVREFYTLLIFQISHFGNRTVKSFQISHFSKFMFGNIIPKLVAIFFFVSRLKLVLILVGLM